VVQGLHRRFYLLRYSPGISNHFTTPSDAAIAQAMPDLQPLKPFADKPFDFLQRTPVRCQNQLIIVAAGK
jgi:hypothetical protein